MIEVVGLGARETLAAAEANLAVRCDADTDLLRLAAHWADLHSPDSVAPPADAADEKWRRLTGRHPVRLGGERTPEVLNHPPAELGVVLQTNSCGAKHLIADALDLRHRLPLLWADVQAGGVRAWKARRVAVDTRHLPLELMAQVDAGLAGLIAVLPWTRFEAILDATIARADPVGTRAAEQESARRRFVAVGRANDHHIKTLIARGDTLDIVSFMAAVNRIADLLKVEGDPDPVDIRRSKALGILARPDQALALLSRHHHDRDEQTKTVPEQGAADAPDQTEPSHVEKPQQDDAPDFVEPHEDTDDEERDELGSRSLDLTGGPTCTCTSKPPRVNLYVHLTDAALSGRDPTAACRVEGVGVITAHTLRAWLGAKDVSIVVRPVAIPGDAVPVDAYEIPTSIREAVRLRNPASAFPWGSSMSRSLQLDHIIAYLDMARGGPPGQTAPDKLGPFAQPEHNLKTHGGWQVRQPAPGVFLWRTPHGWIHLVTNAGTHSLGITPTAHALWAAAAPPAERMDSVLERRLHDLVWPPVSRTGRELMVDRQ